MAPILVTGASGFLGARIVELLAASNEKEIRVFGRPSSYFGAIQHLIDSGVVNVYRGNFSDIESLRDACRDCRFIIHVAALTTDWGRFSDFVSSNVDAVENLCRVALELGDALARFVHVSTNDVYGYPPSGMGDETVPMHDNGMPYITTKIAGECIVRQFVKNFGLKAIILRPSNIYGPRGDSFTVEVAKAVLGINKFWLGSGNHAGGFVYIDNVANAALLALRADPKFIGEAYNVSDEPKATWQQYFDRMALSFGITAHPRRFWRIPLPIAWGLGWLYETAYKMLGWHDWHPPITRHLCLWFGVDGGCDSSKIRRDLGYRETLSFDESVSASVAWCLQECPDLAQVAREISQHTKSK